MRMVPLLLLACLAATAAQYTGQLSGDLLPDHTSSIVLLEAAPRRSVNLPVPPGARAFQGYLFWRKPDDIRVVLVEPAAGAPWIWLNGARHEFVPVHQPENIAWQVVVKLPLENQRYRYYPLRLRLYDRDHDPYSQTGRRTLTQSWGANAPGWIDINGRRIRVTYRYHAASESIDPMNGWLGIDSNGDGEVDGRWYSPESAYADNETVVFRVGSHYVSTKSVDLESGRIVAESHRASGYSRIELTVGGQVPDFTFVDFAGKRRRLSEFRGNYVLLDFWFSGCGPCIADFAGLKYAYRRLHSSGFDILGINTDEDLASARRVIAEQGIQWPQARRDPGLVFGRFRVQQYPTKILFDPTGKIVSLNQQGQLPLDSEQLVSSLEKLLPPVRAVSRASRLRTTP